MAQRWSAGCAPNALWLRSLDVLLRHGLADSCDVPAWIEELGGWSDAQWLEVVAALRDDEELGCDEAWLVALNRWMLRVSSGQANLAAQARSEHGAEGFSRRLGRLRFEPAAVTGARTADGPSVTVAMSCFNNADTVEAAALSVLGQTHTNLELVIVDDASTDGSAEVIADLLRRDGRVKANFNARNVGTYVNRNRVLAESRSTYFCCLDADDLAFPGRLAQQCALLEANPVAVGTLARWVRMTPQGLPVFQSRGSGGFAHHSVSTLMLRRAVAVESLGYWDAVRFEADSEYMNRLVAVHGERALCWSDDVVALAASRLGSLTQDPATGLDDLFGPSADRLRYREAWQAWHRSGERLFLERWQQPRRFPAPDRMLS